MIPAKQFFQEIADEMNRRLAEIPTVKGKRQFIRALEDWAASDPFGGTRERLRRERHQKRVNAACNCGAKDNRGWSHTPFCKSRDV